MRLVATLLLLALGGGPASAQPPTPEQIDQALEAYRRILVDWGSLTRYGSENSELRPQAGRVVFLGDEITENWGPDFFPGKPYLNRGIIRQTTPQMLVRFRQDVIALKPAVVIIQAGTNDLASVMGPSTEGTMAEHFMSMVELAQHHGIRVVLASVTPVCDCFTKMTSRRPAGKIISLNGWLKDYAKKVGAVYLDYHGALVEGRAMKKDYTVDGLIPNAAGYARMAPLAEKAIAEALAR